ncbi:MAG: VanW family protein [Firmicutes bacterium]|nr:VanW family protein [Bacillota bacterium]
MSIDDSGRRAPEQPASGAPSLGPSASGPATSGLEPSASDPAAPQGGAQQPSAPAQAPGATRKVYISPAQAASAADSTRAAARGAAPVRRPSSASSRSASAGSSAARRASARRRRRKKGLSRRDRNILIIAGVILALLILAIIIGIAMLSSSSEEDDGLILQNVYAAGVNIGGTSPEVAKQLLQQATESTYSELDMVVQVLDTTLTLSPAQTGASLDIDAVVEAAYNYGRTGTKAEQKQAKSLAETTSYTLSILPYLTLDTDYIAAQVESLGSLYASTLSQSEYTVTGTQPSLEVSAGVDTTVVYQWITVTRGTPEYGLDTDQLYEQILDAYNSNVFAVTGEISVVLPDDTNLIYEIYDEYCVAPVDAQMDSTTYEITAESYGYGFDLDEALAWWDSAVYGDEITLELTYLAPAFTADDLSSDLFSDTLATKTITVTSSKMLTNLRVAAEILNGTMLRSGDTFAFNSKLGSITSGKGYVTADDWVDDEETSVLGGGLSRMATAMYYCALMADFEILEHNTYTYVTDFTDAGLDAYVSSGSADLIFTNTSSGPIRIDISVSSSSVTVSILGVKNTEYSVRIQSKETKLAYTTLTTTMYSDNPDGYADGDVLVSGVNGMDVEISRVYTYTNGASSSTELVETAHYEKINEVVVAIVEAPTEPPTEVETETEEVTEPEATEPETSATDTSEADSAGSGG